MKLVKRGYVFLTALSLYIVMAGQALALTAQQQAEAIIQASPVVQKIKQNFKPEYGNLSFFVEGLTGKLSKLPSLESERKRSAITPSIIGDDEQYGATGSLSRIAVLLDQQGQALNVTVEQYATISAKFISAISDAKYLHLRDARYLDSSIDLSAFSNLERVTIAFLDNVQQVILPQSGSVEKINIHQTELRHISNLGLQKNLDVFISTAENARGFDELNGNQSLEYLSIELSKSDLDIGSLTNLEKLWVTGPEYKNIKNIDKLGKLKNLIMEDFTDKKLSGVILPKSIETISIYNIAKGSLPQIRSLSSLKRLAFKSIEDNMLKNVEDLPSLQELLITYSNLPTLNGIEKLPSLKDLTVKKSGTIDISAIEALHHLENLQITENYLDDISVIAKLPKLVYADASYNQLKVLPKLQPGNHLESFVFSDNPIETIDPEVLKTYSKVSKRAYRTPFYQSLTRKQQLYF
ncbi:hypothetical protein GTG28_07020 [Vibrio sp. OCN044]|uniref:Internalin n=1 Tax=Vibrio tetraodonis subsp. pristinus TaxID=2695891 RepID=A0A6L8M0J7_9VIBR|nr:leucine-rich repeat domain-containing protein [Vibrio tetraodonis]MYM58972.1 hypothetical protein [Vibrio tetraodonis subsp. pristinus]